MAAITAPQIPDAFGILGVCSDRFGYLRCVPCALKSGHALTDRPITLLDLFDGEETCTDCGRPMVPESLR